MSTKLFNNRGKQKNSWNNNNNNRAAAIEANDISTNNSNNNNNKTDKQIIKKRKNLQHIQQITDHEPFMLNKGNVQNNRSDKYSFENWRRNLYEKILVSYGRVGQEILGTPFPDPILPEEPVLPNALAQITKDLRVKVYLQEYSEILKKREDLANNRIKIIAEILRF